MLKNGPAYNAFRCFFAIYRIVLHITQVVICRTVLHITSANSKKDWNQIWCATWPWGTLVWLWFLGCGVRSLRSRSKKIDGCGLHSLNVCLV